MKSKTFVVVGAWLMLVTAAYCFGRASAITTANRDEQIIKYLEGEVDNLTHRVERAEKQLQRIRDSASKLMMINPHLEQPLEVAGQLVESCDRWGVDVDWMVAMGAAESNWHLDRRGRSGEVGPLQIMPENAFAMGVTDLNDWRQSVEASVKFYSTVCLARAEGDKTQAVAYYNAGQNQHPARDMQLASRHIWRVSEYRRRL